MTSQLHQTSTGVLSATVAELPDTNRFARWRADTGITKDGSDFVSSWVDSDNSHDLAEATNKPLWVDSVINGQPVVRSDGSNDILSVASGITQAQPITAVAILRQRSWAANAQLFDGSAANTFYAQQKGTTPALVHFANGAGTTNSIAGANGVPTVGTSSNFFILFSHFDGASSYQQVGSNAAVSGGNPGTVGLTGSFNMFAEKGGSGRHSNIDIAEIALYSADPDHTDVLAYALEHYGI